MLGSRFWYKSNSHNVCHGLWQWGYSEGHPLVYCRIPNSLACKSSSASPIATAWWGTKRLFQLQCQLVIRKSTNKVYDVFFWQTREQKEQTSLQMDVLIYHFYGGNPLQNDLQSDVMPLNHAVGLSNPRARDPRWSFGVLVYVILVGQFPIGQSKQTKSELTRNIIKVDKEPRKPKKNIPTNQPKPSRG